MLEILIAQTGTPVVQMDGPETVLYGWATVLTIMLTTVLVRLWDRGKENERLVALAKRLSPGGTAKLRSASILIDDLVSDMASGTTPTEKLQQAATAASKKLSEVMSEAGE